MIGELIPTGFTYDQGRVEINDSFSGTANLNNLLLDADFSGGTGGGVIYSAGTDLYNIFLTAAGANDITRVQPGLNTYTGGTGNNPTVNISAATLTYLSATTISGGTIYSGSTDLYDIFCSDCGGSGFSGLTSSTGSNSIIANNGTGNIASGTYGFAIGSGTTASGTSSYAGGNTTKSDLYAEWAMSSGILGQYGSVSYFGKIPLFSGPTQLFLDGGSLSKEFLIPLNTSYYVKLHIVGVVNSGVTSGDTYVGTAEGVIKNVAGTVSFPGGTPFAQLIFAQEGNFAGGGWGGISITPTTPPGSLTVSIDSLDAEDVNWFIRADYTCTNQIF